MLLTYTDRLAKRQESANNTTKTVHNTTRELGCATKQSKVSAIQRYWVSQTLSFQVSIIIKLWDV
jgi:hypothetical protein